MLKNILIICLGLLLVGSVEALPDLAVTNLVAEPANPNLGDYIVMHYEIHNLGDTATDGKFRMHQCIDTWFRCWDPKKELDAGETVTSSITFNTYSYMKVGENKFTIIMDPNNEVDESDETNNEMSVIVNVGPSDLTCSDGTRLGECSAEQPIYCSDYTELKLIDFCEKCGCPEGYECSYRECSEIEVPEYLEEDNEEKQNDDDQEEQDNQEQNYEENNQDNYQEEQYIEEDNQEEQISDNNELENETNIINISHPVDSHIKQKSFITQIIDYIFNFFKKLFEL